jgi:hypothetical protein
MLETGNAENIFNNYASKIVQRIPWFAKSLKHSVSGTLSYPVKKYKSRNLINGFEMKRCIIFKTGSNWNAVVSLWELLKMSFPNS